MIGTTISHYRVTARLGGGGMGEVFLAEDLRLRRPVALKILHQREGRAETERARLLREARAASALNHPNIAVIYDVEESQTESGPAYLLAMEYVSGHTLSELVSASRLSVDDAIDFVSQAAGALGEAHARGVVHGDVKPSNLMVADRRLKILDFGLARVQPALAADAPTWSIDAAAAPGFAGTPPYMSPEQALGRPIDARSDVFSLGIVFYELLVGSRPFQGETFGQLADSILHHDPLPLPVRLTDGRMPEIEALLARMLQKDAAARLGDLRDVRATLERMRAGAPFVAASGALTVAIAGFANISRAAEDEWLGTGLAETVTAALQEIEGVEVWSRERLRESLRRLGVEASELGAEHAAELGRMIGARWVLAGAFQRVGDQMRVTARVVEAASGRVLRAARMDGSITGLFELQDRIVEELVSGLRRSVAAEHEGEETHIIAAYESLSKGLLNVRADTYEGLDRAILFFERALALDPNYARAQIELASAYAQKGEYLGAPELHERASALLRRVLEAHARLPRAWRELGMVLLAEGRVDEGMEHLRRALSLAPEDPRMLAGMARGLFIGKADFPHAAEHFAQAVERSPGAGWYWMQLAHCYALLRDFERGERAVRRAIELQEAYLSGQQGVQVVGAYMRQGHLAALQGRFQEAVDSFVREIGFIERPDHALRSRIRVELHMRLGAAHLAVGDAAAAETAFSTAMTAFTERLRLGADDPFTRYYAAAIHALRGERDEALDLLEKSDPSASAFVLARARLEPEWNGLRGDPRFERFVAPPRPASTDKSKGSTTGH